MTCPQCRGNVSFRDVGKERCPACEARIYFSPGGNWPRGLGCGLLTILLTYRLLPIRQPGADFGAFLLWLGGCFLLYLVLLFASIRVLPPEIELVPPDGPLRLDL
jgi:hypothetical protein